MNKLKQEIFAEGTWNGMPFTQADLTAMAQSFNSLKEYLKVPLKLGHNDEQAVTDGQPALGWVTSMEVAGGKLLAVFEDVPDIVYQAIQKKLYRTVSVEMSFDVSHKSKLYDFVITAVALLGADIPAVNVLNDLGVLMSRNSNLERGGFAAGHHASFNSVFGSIKEKPIMTPEEIAAMQAENAKLKADHAVISANFTALEITSKTEKEEAAKRFAAIEAEQKKAKVEAKRVEFTAILEDAVKAKAITPVQRETFSKVLKLDNDDSVLTLVSDDVKALFGSVKPNDTSTGRNSDGEDEGDSPDIELSQQAHAYMSKSGEKDFSRAVDIVMSGNPELARDYITYNGEVQ